jgi:hypothetical protein
MAIRKFIEEIGEKVLPTRRKAPGAGQQQQQFHFGSPTQYGSGDAWTSPFGNSPADADNECAVAIRKYLASRPQFKAPPDLVVLFNDLDDVVILAGTVRDEPTRELIVQAAGNIRGVEKVDDRMTFALRGGWR